MKFKKSIIFSTAAVSLLSFLLLGGCKRHHFWHASPEKRIDFMFDHISDELDLTDDQNRALERIKQEVLAKKDQHKDAREAIYQTLLRQVKSNRVHQAALNTLMEEKETEFKEMRSFAIEKFTEFHAILTPDQRTELAAHMEKMHDKFHKN